MEAVRELLPKSNALLDRFGQKRQRTIADLPGNTRRALAYQKETVATALTLAGIDRRELQHWQPELQTGAVRSFLDGLPQVRLREDQMLLNGLSSFPGFEVIRTMQHGAVVFTNDISSSAARANACQRR